MGTLNGRIAIVTGAGRGLGASHARLLAREGAAVVVNDLGLAHGEDAEDRTAAAVVAEEITTAGGTAIANGDDVSTEAGAHALVAAAVERFGRLDVVVNNAGILRDQFLTRMSYAEFDAVIAVHLRGHFAVLREAAAHWRQRHGAGEDPQASVINTVSASGTFMTLPGQVNYAAAKAGIAAMTTVAAAELSRIGVRVNAIAPAARTRLTEHVPGVVGEMMARPADADAFDVFDPANVSPLVAHLAAAETTTTGRVFAVQGGELSRLDGWHAAATLTCDGPWTIDDLAARIPEIA